MNHQEPIIAKMSVRRFGLPAKILVLDRPGLWLAVMTMNYHAGPGFVIAHTPDEEAGAMETVNSVSHGQRFRWHSLTHISDPITYAKKMPEVRGFYHSFRYEDGRWKYNFASFDLWAPAY